MGRDRGEEVGECSVEIGMLPEPHSKGHSRASSVSSQKSEEVFAKSPKRAKRRKTGDLELADINLESLKNVGNENNKTLQEVYNERLKLEEFLFNENYKINKPSIKFILEKWSILENKLHQQIMENEVLKAK